MSYQYNEEFELPVMDEQEFAHAKDHLEGLVNDIYKTGSIEDLEFHLEEVLSIFGINMPHGKPVIVKQPTQKQVSTERALQAWVGYTRAYAEMLTNKKL
jgi:hypothetical protein